MSSLLRPGRKTFTPRRKGCKDAKSSADFFLASLHHLRLCVKALAQKPLFREKTRFCDSLTCQLRVRFATYYPICLREIPVPRFHPVACVHLGEQSSTGVRRQNVEGGGRNSNLDGPVNGEGEYVPVISIQAEDEAAINHDAEAIESADNFGVAAPEILALARALEARIGKRFEASKQTSQTGVCRFFDKIIA